MKRLPHLYYLHPRKSVDARPSEKPRVAVRDETPQGTLCPSFVAAPRTSALCADPPFRYWSTPLADRRRQQIAMQDVHSQLLHTRMQGVHYGIAKWSPQLVRDKWPLLRGETSPEP